MNTDMVDFKKSGLLVLSLYASSYASSDFASDSCGFALTRAAMLDVID